MLCFSPCILSLCLTLLTHTIIHHSFADDFKLQMSAPPDKISELLHSIQSCISDVIPWATANMPKLNDNKTKLMLVICRRTKHLHNLPTSITIGNAQIPSSSLWKIWVLHWTVILLWMRMSPILLVHATLNCVVRQILFVDSSHIQRLPHLYLLLLSQELTTVTHCCLVLLMMWHPTCNG